MKLEGVDQLLRKIHLILPGIGFLLLLVIIFLSGDGDCSQFEATLSLDYPTAEAYVGPGQTGIATFSGILTCNITGLGQNTQTITAKLTARIDDWDAGVSPDEIEIEPDDEKTVPFSVTVKVPRFTSSTETREVVISGSATLEPGGQTYPIEPVIGKVTVKEYIMLTISCDKPYLETERGGTVYFILNIRNDGNTECPITITIDNLEELREFGFKLELSDSDLILSERGDAEVKVTVETPEKDDGIFKIDVTVKSNLSEDMDREDVGYYTFFVRMVPTSGNVCTIFFWAIISSLGFFIAIVIGLYVLSKRKKVDEKG